ncbi:MAG: glycosyltransferase family 4 protein [Rikenellaceae bacterium]|jgi:glycosyltransferase involved in cell wall biosynthesis|nr:glycosyltransferase family 4 protein [Rikenellaceae bacterium]
MKVLFDNQVFSWQRYGGVSRYFAYLYDHLPEAGVRTEVAARFTENSYLDLPHLPPYDKSGWLQRKKHRMNRRYQPKRILQGGYDVFHPTYYDPYYFDMPIQCPVVLTVHDMICMRMPHVLGDLAESELANQRASIPHADKIIAISEHTKKDLLEFFPALDPARVEVIHHGLLSPRRLKLPRQAPVEGDYILFVGSRDSYKNFTGFLPEAAAAARRHRVRIVCVGGGPFTGDEQALIAAADATDITIQMEVDEGTLRWLYENAACFVYPSIYEGFGLPILEAFDADCPQVLAHATCFPEIAADAALYFEPGREGSLAAALEMLLGDRALRSTLIARGRERLDEFPASKMIEKTADLYRSLV